MSRKVERRQRRALWALVRQLGRQGVWPAENVKLWVNKHWPDFVAGRWINSP